VLLLGWANKTFIVVRHFCRVRAPVSQGYAPRILFWIYLQRIFVIVLLSAAAPSLDSTEAPRQAILSTSEPDVIESPSRVDSRLSIVHRDHSAAVSANVELPEDDTNRSNGAGRLFAGGSEFQVLAHADASAAESKSDVWNGGADLRNIRPAFQRYLGDDTASASINRVAVRAQRCKL
jgi:hypothetical protein